MSGDTFNPTDTSRVRLSDGHDAPTILFGAGTVHLKKDVSDLVQQALRTGYRGLDLAYCYHNNESVGRGIKASGVPRSDIYISYKGADLNSDPKDRKPMKWCLDAILKDLDTDYIDLYTLHSVHFATDVKSTWREMEELHRAGVVKSLGIGNPTSETLQEILEIATVKPAVMEIEYHPYCLPSYDRLLPVARDQGMTVLSYSPMVPIFWEAEGPVPAALDEIIHARGRKETRGQILLAWIHQHHRGMVSTTTRRPERLAEQLGPFLHADRGGMPPLSEADMRKLTEAGAKKHHRHWGKNWPHMSRGEDNQAPPGATHFPPPVQSAAA